jgi:sugar transferase EpsL
VKRLFDLTAAGVLLVLLLPVLLVVALLVRWRLGRPILFIQPRVGRNGRPFSIVKFRTMRHSVDDQGRLLPDHMRLTPFGRWLRATSLDELPQLWNVVRGKMSLVGPRPLLLAYGPLLSATQARRHEVLPGIIGWAQIHGRNKLSWEEKFALDQWYVDNHTLLVDLLILARTAGIVLGRQGIDQSENVTMEPFRGAARGGAP